MKALLASQSCASSGPRVDGASTLSGLRPLRPRRGFTLIEVLVSLSLMLVLMVAVYAALDRYRRYSSMGREATQRSQLARALLNRMAVDVRSVLYRARQQSGEGSSSNSGTGSTSGTESQTIEVTDASDSLSAGTPGLFGDAGTLVLHVNRPRRPASALSVADGGTVPSGGDLQSVAYFLAGSGTGALQELVASDNMASSGTPAQGLARLQGDLFTIRQADEFGDVQILADSTEVLAAEVAFLEFRYFDGFEWLDAWDTTAYERLPNAVEIVIGFGPDDENSETAAGYETANSTELYRLVVAPPLAEPYVEEPVLTQ